MITKSTIRAFSRQQGISLPGLIVTLALIGMIAILGLKLVPIYSEKSEIDNAIKAMTGLSSVREIQGEFNRRAMVAGVTAISGQDLVIVKNGSQHDISYAYERKVPLVGPASLLLEFAGSTNPNATPAAADEAK